MYSEKEIIENLGILCPTILTVSVIFCVAYYKYIDKLHKCLAIYLMLMLTIEFASRTLGYIGSNFIVLPIYCLIELLFALYFYNTFFIKRNQKFFIAIGLIGGIYIIIETIMHFVIGDLNIKQFQPYSKVVDNFIIILMCLAFFLEKVNIFKNVNQSLFKLNIIILIFFTVTTLVFLPFNFLVNGSTELKFYFWLLNIISLASFELYLTYSIWQNARQNKSLKKPA